MSNRQIQPVRPRDYQLARQVRPRSLWGQVWTIALQPGYFFRTLSPMGDNRQWFWVAILILGLVGLSAVRQDEIQNPVSSASAPPVDFSSPPGTDLGGKGSIFSGGSPSVIVSPGGETGPLGPTDGGGDGSTPISPATSPDQVSSTLTTALIAASHILLGWFILAVLLCEIPLFNGRRPSFGQNLQIAIWASVPLGIMAGLQVVYYAAGGGVGLPGLSGLLSAWKSYETFSAFPKSIALSFAIRITLFWLWTLLLLYQGGRNALEGKRWAVIFVIIAWTIVLVVVPVVTGTVTAEPSNTTPDITTSNGLPFDNTGLVDPATQLDNQLPNNGTLPAELQFLVKPTNSEPEATPEPGILTFATIPPSEGGGNTSPQPTSPPKG